MQGAVRGPVREAIRELAREGLIAELPRRGTVVSTLTARDLAQVYAVREGIEIAASNAVVKRASDGEIAGLERWLVAMETPSRENANYALVAERDFAFHRAFVALAGNTRMSAFTDQMLSQTALSCGRPPRRTRRFAQT